jgi:hypothetical protein
MEQLRRLILGSSILLSGSGCAAPSVEQPSFVGKVWISTDSTAALGTMRMFLPDGTLLMTSCVETYRLARWENIDGNRIAWSEDTARLEAEIAQATPEELQLRIRLVNGELREEGYRQARVPYVCPAIRGLAFGVFETLPA